MNQPRRVLAAAALAALTLTAPSLTGCAHSAADAAVVDGVVISDAEVAAAAAAAAPITQQEANVLGASVVQAEVQGLISEKIAAKHAIALTDASRAEVVSANATLKALLATPGGKTLGIRLADTSVVAGQVGNDVFATECSAASVSLNPRYGTWSKELCALDSAIGSLSKPAPTASATKG